MTTQLMSDGPERPNYSNRVNAPQRAEQALHPIAVFALCDSKCPAEAVFRITRPPATSELFFCAHHYREHEPAIAARGWTPEQLRELPS